MASETVFSNARLVLPDAVITGSIVVRDGLIAEIDEGSSHQGEDLGGDVLIPGLVELHTDHLETHYSPRPRVRWNAAAALQAHDAQIAASGITTVFDALRVGTDEDAELRVGDMRLLADAIEAGLKEDRLRADHFIHLRCEVSAPDCQEGFLQFAEDKQVRLVSLMDHAPGQRQFVNLDSYKAYYMGRNKMSEAAFQVFCERRIAESETYAPPQRAAISALCHEHGIPIASHDDATAAHVAESAQYGVRIAEFPTTIEAAQASHDAGLAVLMGGPNVVRGGSHSGNVSAASLIGHGLLDVLSSDYIPFSLIQAAFHLADGGAVSLPQAIALVTKQPAEVIGLEDRGELAVGKRADLVQVRVGGDVPVVRKVWRQGVRVV
jgi:alpha-D-ribose 1-methylphosphonate 5-triphosphate diphosphatase